jgi:pilus assembly protein Flp/PilA
VVDLGLVEAASDINAADFLPKTVSATPWIVGQITGDGPCGFIDLIYSIVTPAEASDLLVRNVGRSSVVDAGNPTRRASMTGLIRHFLSDERGATAIEYGLIAAGISVVIIVAVNTIGTNLNSTFSSISSQLK